VDSTTRARVDELLRKLLELPENQRDQYLEQACAGETDLAVKVRRLLDSGSEEDGFLTPGGAQQGAVWAHLLTDMGRDEETSTGADELVGDYRIIRQIGRGGMGAVYLARHTDEPDRQPVALKVLSSGFDDNEVVHRFAQERAILASLDHPAIARHIDGGVTAGGRPYFAMEHVDGQPVDIYCDLHRLTLEERLRLFIDIARAVQYAHRAMVVHRDLKPSNILVTEDKQVKLLDFGIAKLLDQGSSGLPEPLTRTGLRVMTPEYASPEQVQGKLITTATDVYQLGLVLYQLLTGQRPYRIAGYTAVEIEQVICEEEPLPPSLAVAQRSQAGEPAGPSPTVVGAARRSRPERLRAQLKGDLDTILLMTLRKEPDRRYQSVGQLIQDIERHLQGRPISARKDTVVYRALKFVRRHRLGITLSAAILVVIAILTGFLIERQMTEHDRTRHEARQAEQVAAFFEGLFDVARPGPGEGETVSAKELLDHGADRIAKDLDLQPQMQATLMRLLGDMYRKLGMYDQAQPLLEQALATHRTELGERHADVASSLAAVGHLYLDIGRFDEAEMMYQQALEIQSTVFSEDSLEIARCRANLADLYVASGNLDEAEPLYLQAQLILVKGLGAGDPEVARALMGLSSLYWLQGRYDEAEPLLQQALTIYETAASPDNREYAIALGDLGQLHARRGEYDQAEALLRRGHDVLEEELGADHPDAAMSLKAIARLLAEQGRLDEAEPLFEQVLTTLRNAYQGSHPDVGECLQDLALLAWEQEAYDKAEGLLKQALAIAEETLGANHPDVAAGLNSLGALHSSQDRLDEARNVYRRALTIVETELGPEHPHLAVVLVNLASVAAAQGKTADAIPLCERAVSINEQALGEEHTEVAHCRSVLAELYAECGRYSDAERLLRSALRAQESAFGPVHAAVSSTLQQLCTNAIAQARYDQAAPLCQRALAINDEILGADHPDSTRSMTQLATLYTFQGRYRQAESLLGQCLTAVEGTQGTDSPALIPLLNQLARVATRQDRHQVALELLDRALEISTASHRGGSPDQLLAHAETLLDIGDVRQARAEAEAARHAWSEVLEITAGPLDEGTCSVSWQRVHTTALLHLGRVLEARPLVAALKAAGYAHPDLENAWEEQLPEP
jgi:serine/threonine-protein kinase